MLAGHRLDVAAVPAADVKMTDIQSHQFEMIMMRPVTLGRAGATITRLAEIVHALADQPNHIRIRHSFGQVMGADRDVIDRPVMERTVRRIGIVTEKCETMRSLWCFRPSQRWRPIRAVAAIPLRHFFSVFESRTA